MSDLKTKQFDAMYALLEEWTHRRLWGNSMITSTGHLGLCSIQGGPPERCQVCGTTIRGINLLKEIDSTGTKDEC
jgi:hypothetical protein